MREPASPHTARIFFLIRSLDRGGAQRQLVELVRGLDRERFEPTVCTFYDGGCHWDELADTPHVHRVSLAKLGRWDVLPFLARLERAVLAARPHLIHGYMPVANELALLMARRVGAACVWGLRASNMDLAAYGRMSQAAYRAGAIGSRFADAIIVNSAAGKEHYAAYGYRSDRMTVISNGIDCNRFRPDAHARARIREELGVAPHTRLVGLVARLDPMKDHDNFLRAAATLARGSASVKFVCVGEGPPAYTETLKSDAVRRGLDVAWLGDRADTAALYNAMDIAVLASAFGEGFPNVVGEAMATGIPCVVTDVGDAALVVGETGSVVPTRDPEALANAIGSLLERGEEDLRALGAAARRRVEAKFSIPRLVSESEATFRQALRRRFPVDCGDTDQRGRTS